jgi:uncharacterized membrane protein (DUF2068 family)
METDDGVRFARCLRCDAWVIADPGEVAAGAGGERLADLSKIEMPQRGKALKDALVLKLIALDRGLHAVVFALVAVIVLVLELHLAPVQGQVRRFLDDTQSGVAGTGQDASRSFFVRQLQHLADVHRHTLIVLLFTATVYAVLEGAEAVGLWRQRRWAEYLTAIATAGFLPLELHELAKRVSVGRVVALVVNLAVLGYLLWSKHLFGIRGGARRDEEELRTAELLPPLPGQFPDTRSAVDGDGADHRVHQRQQGGALVVAAEHHVEAERPAAGREEVLGAGPARDGPGHGRGAEGVRAEGLG